jgi:hypothetical protein
MASRCGDCRLRRSVIAPMGETTTTHPNLRRFGLAIAFAGLLAALVALIGLSPADATNAKVIGKTKQTPGPACPNRNHPLRCQVVGRVTGFMTVADGQKRPFKVRRNGKLVAWAMDLSKPADSKKFPQRNVFGTLFGNKELGKAPTARLAVLKRKEKNRYALVRQSKTVELTGSLGQKQIFTLNKPLTVRKGQIVAVTYPTWAPNFAHRHITLEGNQWQASRTKDNCAPKNSSDKARDRFVRNSHSQQKVGSQHTYGCHYTGGRLLYWAYFVPKKKG